MSATFVSMEAADDHCEPLKSNPWLALSTAAQNVSVEQETASMGRFPSMLCGADQFPDLDAIAWPFPSTASHQAESAQEILKLPEAFTSIGLGSVHISEVAVAARCLFPEEEADASRGARIVIAADTRPKETAMVSNFMVALGILGLDDSTVVIE